LFLAGLPGWYPAFRERRQMEKRENVKRELCDVILPRVSFEDVTFEEALRVLKSDARKAGLREGIRFIAVAEEDARKAFRRRVRKQPSAFDEALARSAPNERPENRERGRVTIRLNHVPVYEALRYVAFLSDHSLRVKEDSVELFPLADREEGTFETLTKKAFHFLPEYSARFREDGPDGKLDIEVLLEQKGVVFYEGTFAHFNDGGTELAVVNTQTEIERIDDLMYSGCPNPLDFTFAERTSNWIHSIFVSPVADFF
jgi:hypothetical protein